MVRRRKTEVTGAEEVARKRLPSLGTALNRETKSVLRRHGDWWFGQMAERFRYPLVPYGTPNNNAGLHSRTGFLRNSLHKKVEGQKLRNLRLKLWSDSPYAATQEYGGVIRARRTKYMAIPIDDNLTAAGVPKVYSPRELMNDPDVRFVELSTGLFIVRDKRGGGSTGLGRTDTEFLFALRKEVDIPGPESRRNKRPSRLGIRDTALGKESLNRLERRLIRGIGRAVAAATGGGRKRRG